MLSFYERLGAGFFAAADLTISRFLFAADTSVAPCMSNKEHSLSEYPILAGDLKTRGDALFKEVPMGLLVKNEIHTFVFTRLVGTRVVPSDQSPSDTGLQSPYRFTSPCIVEDSSKRQWAAKRFAYGGLEYVPLESLELAETYDKH